MNAALWSLTDHQARATDRLAWGDVAKAISITLVVLWTTAADAWRVSELLVLVRMPLFFFLAGLFAHRAITATSFRELFRDKFSNLVYLYVLWETLLFLGRNVAAHFLWGSSIDPARQLTLLWEPIFNQWFLYALAWAFLAAWLLRRAPAWLVLAGAFALYAFSVWSGEWRHLSFVDRVIRLFPFFWLGLMAQPVVGPWVERYRKYWPLAIGAFLALAASVYGTAAAGVAPLTFAISLVGIAGMLLLARQLSTVPVLGNWLCVVGASTLYIYVAHKLFLFYVQNGLRSLGIEVPAAEVVFALAAVIVCTIVGRWAHRQPVLEWAFTAPWVRFGSTPRRRDAVRTA